MDGRNRPAFDKMPNTQESSLNIKTGMRIYLRKSIPGSKGREPEKERDANMKSFHVNNPCCLDLFSKIVVNNFEPFAKA